MLTLMNNVEKDAATRTINVEKDAATRTNTGKTEKETRPNQPAREPSPPSPTEWTIIIYININDWRYGLKSVVAKRIRYPRSRRRNGYIFI